VPSERLFSSAGLLEKAEMLLFIKHNLRYMQAAMLNIKLEELRVTFSLGLESLMIK